LFFIYLIGQGGIGALRTFDNFEENLLRYSNKLNYIWNLQL
jgi:hypothetical protein